MEVNKTFYAIMPVKISKLSAPVIKAGVSSFASKSFPTPNAQTQTYVYTIPGSPSYAVTVKNVISVEAVTLHSSIHNNNYV